MFRGNQAEHKKSSAIQLMGLYLYMILILAPIIFLVSELIIKLAVNNNDLAILLGYSERRTDLLTNSISLALCVSVTGTLFGTLIAITVWNSRRISKKVFYSIFILILPIPAYIHALAWMYSFNGLNRIPNFNIGFQGFYASAFVQFMSLLPVSIALALVGLEHTDKGLIEAARIFRDERRTLFKVAVPLAGPMILAGTGIVFLLSIIDYSIPSLFQYNVYSLEIFAEYSSSGDSGHALLLSLPLIIVSLLALRMSQNGIRNTVAGYDRSARELIDIFELPKWFRSMQIIACTIFVLQMLVPVLTLIFQPGAWRMLFSSFSGITAELCFTFGIAAITSLLCLFPAYGAASLLKSKGKHSGLLWMIALLPVAIPAPLTGIAIVGMFNRPVLQMVSGTLIMPVFGCMARFMPFSFIIILAQLHRIDPLFIDAANLLVKNSFVIWFKVRLPLMAPGLLASFCIVFILASGELGATLLLIPPGFETLTIKIYNYMHYGASDKVAGLCLMMMMTVLLCGTAAIKLLNAGRRWHA